MNFPNTLSLIRILLAPVFLYLFLSGDPVNVFFSFIVYTIAALTDWYDGWFARKYGFKTRWGQFIDPLADKILTSSAFIGFYFMKKQDPYFLGRVEFIPIGILILIIIFRDIVLTAARSVQELRGKEFRTSMISKTKTFIQMTFIFLIIALLAASSITAGSGFSLIIIKYLHSDLNYYILLLVTLLTAASGITYIFESNPAGVNRS
ncbi:MAG: CDP-alcohol phosphatidyltransferase family protein [Ignavibacteria bacterium]|nr:CDP-alcohol phosphatidyltransferase family protein [Ignavibacteria bacterium]MCC7158332.1 CDP-alcohol phosphatidyltransferase family protein [Ignavibacteria bacterium]